MLLFLLSLLCVSGHAVSEEELLRQELKISEVEHASPAEAEEIYGSITLEDVAEPAALLQKLWTSLTGSSHDLLYSALRGGAAVLAAAFLSALCSAFVKSDVVSAVGVCVVSLVSLDGLSSCFAVGREALSGITELSHVLLPCLCTAAAAGGAVTSAGAKYAASMLFLDGLISLERDYASVLLSAYAALTVTAGLTENPMIHMLSGLVKQGMKWALVLIAAAFTCYLSLTGILSGTADAAAAKAAKTAISSALPVVGSILADASSALLSGAQMLRNGVGALGLFFVLAVCASPYLTLGSHYLVYQLAGGAASSLGSAKIGGVIKDLGSVYGFLLGMVGSACLMFFVSVISLMKTVVP